MNSQEQSNFARQLAAIAENQNQGFMAIIKQAEKAQEENAKIQAENAKIQAFMKAEIIKQSKEIAEIKASTARIEANTIVIRDIVISDFASMSADTKKIVEAGFAEIYDDSEKMDALCAHFDLEADIREEEKAAKAAGEARKRRRQVPPYVQTAKIYQELNPDCTKGDKTSVGNWVSSVMAQFFKRPTFGKYPLELQNLVETLVMYYAMERQPNGRKY